MKTPKWKKSAAQFVESVSIGQPAVRLVVVEGWSTFDEATGEWIDCAEVHPVVGLSVVATRRFVKDGEHDQPATPTVAARDGWYALAPVIEYRPLIVDDHYGLIDLTTFSELVTECNAVVACPWPPDEDEQRLALLVERAKLEARKRRPTAAADVNRTTATA